MVLVITAVCAFLAGAILAYAMCNAAIRSLRAKLRAARAELAGRGIQQKRETMKVVVWACVLNGFAWVWCSYILAALDKPQIAEELSKVALVEIIAPVTVYAFKSVVENLSKNNHWPDRRPADADRSPDQEETDGGGAAG